MHTINHFIFSGVFFNRDSLLQIERSLLLPSPYKEVAIINVYIYTSSGKPSNNFKY